MDHPLSKQDNGFGMGRRKTRWTVRNYRFNSPPPPRGASVGRLFLPVIILLFVAFGCGQYGVQIWQREGLNVAWFTLALAAAAALVALVILFVAIRALRSGHREAEATRLRNGVTR